MVVTSLGCLNGLVSELRLSEFSRVLIQFSPKPTPGTMQTKRLPIVLNAGLLSESFNEGPPTINRHRWRSHSEFSQKSKPRLAFCPNIFDITIGWFKSVGRSLRERRSM
jgi:hypothetical protein